MPRERTIMFIDNSNVFHGQRNAGWRIDVKKLHAHLEREGEIWQTFIFASVTDPPRYRQTAFYTFLKTEMRYEVLLYTLGSRSVECRRCGDDWTVPLEKGLDVGLATKMLTLANARAFDTAILVAADKDYLETVQAVKAMGLRVEILAWRGTISWEMENESSKPTLYFDDIRDEIELTETPDEEAESLTSGEEDRHEPQLSGE